MRPGNISDNLNLPDLLEGIGKFDSSTPADVLWKSSLSERENILNIIENLTSKLLQIGDKFSFLDRKKLLKEYQKIFFYSHRCFVEIIPFRKRNSFNIIENLTSKLFQIGDKFSFIDRKKLLNEISENILLLQIKDFCPNKNCELKNI